MIKRAALCMAVLAVAAALGALADAPRTRDFDFTYSAKVTDLPADAHRVDIWLPYPVSDDHQEVTVTSVSSPYPHEVLQEPKYGNSILHITVTDPKEHEAGVEMKVHVRRKEYLHNQFA